MKVLCTLSKSTKRGLSVFTFVKNDAGQFWMFGGCSPKAIQFDSLQALNAAVTQWRRYGFVFGAKGSPKPAPKKQFVSDPWESSLPAKMQMELEALSAV